MSHPPSGPGKTAPKLYHDFLLFDPLNSGKQKLLPDHSPPVGEGPQVAPPIGSCKHDYTTKPAQSVTPPLDQRPDSTTRYRLATVCKKCRIHADIQISYLESTNACPNAEYPLHHFQRVQAADVSSNTRVGYGWKCSAPQCHASLSISFSRARLGGEDIALMTSTDQLKQRFDDVVEEDPEREGIKQATPTDALNRLRKYIKDGLKPEHERRKFPANNKRFMEAFGVHGQDCRGLLERLGFLYGASEYTLPNPPRIEHRLDADGSSQREMLEDVEMELLALMAKTSSESATPNPAAAEGWPSAEREVERVLAAQGYLRHRLARRTVTANDELAYFTSLGIQPDFSDTLVEFAYERQTHCDPERTAYYFECLQVVTDARATEQLQMKVATLQSQDLVSRRDLRAAYRSFNINSDSANISDERILELFQAQQPDLGSAAQEKARQELGRIGTARQSQRLISASLQSVDTYEDALGWLGNGADKNMSDESLLAIIAVKSGEGKQNEELGQKAISTIARARKSNVLNNWLATGQVDGYTMSVDEALRHFDIQQSLNEVDPTTWPAIFDNARESRQGEMTEKAISVINQALAGAVSTASHSPETWPVGLTSHGNTCYLNSLLQYYFSIKPLRDIVLNYDDYKLDTSDDVEKIERVGQRKISMVEIKGGQAFAQDLKHLFQRMIKDRGPAVKPEEDLVCRAFLEPKDFALLTHDVREQAAATNGVTEAIVEEKSAETQEVNGVVVISNARKQSDASSATLQGSMNGEDVLMEAADTPPTPPDSDTPLLEKEVVEEPAHAPPLPPRRFSTTKEEALSRAQANARQQHDVTEVHDGITFRLRSGMVPRGTDATGEQKDPLRDLFSIGMVETTLKKGVPSKPKELPDSSIQLNVPTEPTDLYSAMDAVFDLQQYEENSDMETYRSINSLPPVLQISLPRIGFDKQRGGTYKATEMVRLEDELYMDRYTDRADVLPRRKTCWGWRKQLQALSKEHKALSHGVTDLDAPTTLAEASNYIANLSSVNTLLDEIDIPAIPVPDSLPSLLSTEASTQQSRLRALSTEISSLQSNLTSHFADLKSHHYRLAAVFIHRGGPGHGHYWIYVHDFTHNLWRIYNDERVEQFTKLGDIYEAKEWDQGTPTYAVYVEESRKGELVQPVCRQPEEEAKGWEDVQMGEAEGDGCVDPRVTVKESGGVWDPQREVVAGGDW